MGSTARATKVADDSVTASSAAGISSKISQTPSAKLNFWNFAVFWLSLSHHALLLSVPKLIARQHYEEEAFADVGRSVSAVKPLDRRSSDTMVQ